MEEMIKELQEKVEQLKNSIRNMEFNDSGYDSLKMMELQRTLEKTKEELERLKGNN